MANMLAQLFGNPSASEAPTGSGLATMAKNTASMKNQYDKYVIDTQSSGEEPMSFDEWSKSQTNKS